MKLTKQQIFTVRHLNSLGAKKVKELKAANQFPERWNDIVDAWLKTGPSDAPLPTSRKAAIKATRRLR